MAVFNPKEVSDQQLDWTTLRDGGVVLYWRPEVLAEDMERLRSAGYHVIEFNADQWKSEEQMHESLKAGLSFPDYYHRPVR